MAYLVLSNGAVFEGTRIGAPGDSVGELVFTTGVVGYLETLTDPAYAGQIVVQTFPLIGNYGVIEEDLEGDCFVRGYVVRELCEQPSNFRSEYDLDTFLKEKGVCGICGVDTRELTRILREEGTMGAVICEEIPADLTPVQTYRVAGAVAQVTCREAQVYPAEGETCRRVTLIDYGTTRHLIRSLCERGCQVTVVPADTAAADILADKPDGVVLSGGPGDPAENTACIAEVAQLIGNVPVLGIGLGHQLAALAMGGKTEKLKHGHRGSNQPAKEVGGSRTYMTDQNHGYAVIADSLEGIARQTFTNANDGTCAGLEYPARRDSGGHGKGCVTVQFYPGSGPRETAFLFDRFIDMMGED